MKFPFNPNTAFSGALLVAVMTMGIAPICAADGFQNIDTNAVLGGAIGGGAGAAVGSAVGGRNGAIVGSAVGAAAGVVIATPDRPRRVEYEDEYHDHGRHRGHHKHHHHED